MGLTAGRRVRQLPGSPAVSSSRDSRMREYIGISDPGAMPILAVHDEIVVECDEKDVDKAKAWLEKLTIDGMNEIVNGLKTDGPPVPIAVEVESGKSWGGE